jgi:hypothetical protein
VLKPVTGGSHCRRLASVRAQVATRPGTTVTASPAILQEELIPPEVRVFAVGTPLRFACFRMLSPQLDYRADHHPRISPCTPDDLTLLDRLGALLREYRLDFSASDFKTCPRTGELIFLEVNSGPMFEGFDRCAWEHEEEEEEEEQQQQEQEQQRQVSVTLEEEQELSAEQEEEHGRKLGEEQCVKQEVVQSVTQEDGQSAEQEVEQGVKQEEAYTKNMHTREMTSGDTGVGPVVELIVRFLLGADQPDSVSTA